MKFIFIFLCFLFLDVAKAQVKIFEQNITVKAKHFAVVKNLSDSDFIIAALEHKQALPLSVIFPKDHHELILNFDSIASREDIYYGKLLMQYFVYGKLFTIVQGNKTNNLFVIETDLKTGVGSIRGSILISPKETTVNYDVDSNGFYVLTSIDNKLFLNRWSAEGKSEHFEKDITITSFGKYDVYNGGLGMKRVKGKDLKALVDNFSAEIENNFQYPILYTQNKSKLYTVPGYTIFAVENEKHETHVLSISNKNLDFKQYTFTSVKVGDSLRDNCSNSYLIDTLLITILATRQPGDYGNIRLNFYNLNNGELLKAYSYSTIDSACFLKDNISKTGDYWSASVVKRRTIDDFVDDLVFNSPALCVLKDNSEYNITIGTYYHRTTLLGTLAFVGSVASTAATMNAALNPKTFYSGGGIYIPSGGGYGMGYGSLFYSNKSKKDIISGSISISNKSYELLKEEHKDVFETMSAFETEKGSPHEPLVFNQNNAYYFGYYDSKSHNYSLYKF